jgi:pilus assembly protein CpaE
MTVVVESDPTRADGMCSALTGAVLVGTVDRVGAHLRAHLHETVVVLGASVPMPDALALARELRMSRPAAGVILLRARIDSTVLSEALRAGIRDVVDARDLTELRDAVHRARALGEALAGGTVPQAPTADGRLVTVFSTKGGVGKSTVATNLAAALVATERRVCIVDLDVEGGDVAVMLQLFPTSTLAGLRDLRGEITPDSVRTLVTEHRSGLAVVAAPLAADAREQVSAEEVGRLLTCLKSVYDVVVVDTSGSFDDHALHALDVTDLLVLVATLDIPALKNLKVAVGTLDLLNQSRTDWRLIVNRADAKVGLSVAEFESTVGIDVAATLPSSREVLTCVNQGEPIVLARPRHEVSRTLRGLAQGVAESVAVPGVPGDDAVPAPAASTTAPDVAAPTTARPKRRRHRRSVTG